MQNISSLGNRSNNFTIAEKHRLIQAVRFYGYSSIKSGVKKHRMRLNSEKWKAICQTMNDEVNNKKSMMQFDSMDDTTERNKLCLVSNPFIRDLPRNLGSLKFCWKNMKARSKSHLFSALDYLKRQGIAMDQNNKLTILKNCLQIFQNNGNRSITIDIMLQIPEIFEGFIDDYFKEKGDDESKVNPKSCNSNKLKDLGSPSRCKHSQESNDNKEDKNDQIVVSRRNQKPQESCKFMINKSSKLLSNSYESLNHVSDSHFMNESKLKLSKTDADLYFKRHTIESGRDQTLRIKPNQNDKMLHNEPRNQLEMSIELQNKYLTNKNSFYELNRMKSGQYNEPNGPQSFFEYVSPGIGLYANRMKTGFEYEEKGHHTAIGGYCNYHDSYENQFYKSDYFAKCSNKHPDFVENINHRFGSNRFSDHNCLHAVANEHHADDMILENRNNSRLNRIGSSISSMEYETEEDQKLDNFLNMARSQRDEELCRHMSMRKIKITAIRVC